jgi:hypothetical protein
MLLPPAVPVAVAGRRKLQTARTHLMAVADIDGSARSD